MNWFQDTKLSQHWGLTHIVREWSHEIPPPEKDEKSMEKILMRCVTLLPVVSFELKASKDLCLTSFSEIHL